MRNIQDKKGMSIGDMYPAVLTIILVGIVLGVGLYVLATFHDQISPDVTGAQTLVNGSTGTTTLTESTADEYYLKSMVVINTTIGGSVTNYTTTTAGVITWGADVVTLFASDTVNITTVYITDDNDEAGSAVTTTVTGLATFADWIAIIVVVIAAAIVLGIVLTSFGRKRNTI